MRPRQSRRKLTRQGKLTKKPLKAIVRRQRQRLRVLFQKSQRPHQVEEIIVDAAREVQRRVKNVAQVAQKSKWFYPSLKLILAAILLCQGLFILSLTVLQLLLAPQTIIQEVETYAYKNWGIHLTIQKLDFSVWSGLQAHDIRVMSPVLSETRQAYPIAEIDHIVVTWPLWKLAFLCLDISEVQLKKPRFFVTQLDKSSNLDFLSSQEKAHHGNQVLKKPTTQHSSNNSLQQLPLIPAKVILPFFIDIGKLGFSDLQVTIVNQPKQERLQISGLSAFVSAHWFLRQSDFQINIDAKPLQVRTQKEGQDAASVDMMVQFNLKFQDFQHLTQVLNLKLLNAQQGSFKLAHVDLSLTTQAFIDPLLNQFKFEKIALQVMDALYFDLVGDLSLPEYRLQYIDSHLTSNLKVDFFALNPLIKQFMPNTQFFGALTMNNFKIQGRMDFEKKSGKLLKWPHISGVAHFVDIHGDLAPLGLKINPINGHLALGAGPSILGEGHQLDVWQNLHWSGLELSNASEKFSVSDLELKLITRLLYPRLEWPFFKLDIRAKEITADHSGFEPIKVPFNFSINTDYSPTDQNFHLTSRLEMPDLAYALLNSQCQGLCQQVQVVHNAEISSLVNLYRLIKPVLLRQFNRRTLPESVAGWISTKGNFELEFNESPLGKNIQDLMTKARVKYNTELDVNDLTLALPEKQMDMAGFNFRWAFRGSERKHTLAIRQSFSRLQLGSLVLGANHRLQAEHFNLTFDTKLDVKNLAVLLEKQNLAQLIKNINTKTQLDLALGYLDSGWWSRPLNDMKVNLSSRSLGLQLIELTQARIQLPDFGLVSRAVAGMQLSPQLEPQNLRAQFEAEIDHEVGKVLTSGVKTSGRFKLQTKLSAQDMNKFHIDGELMFRDFSMEVPDLNNADQPLLRLVQANGAIPLTQSFDLRDLRQLKQQQKTDIQSDQTLGHLVKNYLLKHRDPFSQYADKAILVDYENIKTLANKRRSLQFDQLYIRGLELNHLEFEFVLQQNWLALNQFAVNFLGGEIRGSCHFIFDPWPLGVKASIHYTQLDTRKLIDNIPQLRDKISRWRLFSDPYLAGNIHINYDLVNNELGGIFEMTRIGKEQLNMILYYVDPQQKDPTIQLIRHALYVGEVRQVSVPIKNGLMGLSVDVRLLSLPVPTPQLQNFPLAQLLHNVQESAAPVSSDRENPGNSDDDNSSDENKEPEDEKADQPPLVH